MKLNILLSACLGVALIGGASTVFACGSCQTTRTYNGTYYNNTYTGTCPTSTCHYTGSTCNRCNFSGTFFYPKSIVTNAQRLGYEIVSGPDGCKVRLVSGCVYRALGVDNAGNKWILEFSPTTGKLINRTPV